ncbi:MAG: Membrane protein involved in the export of O-antigen and teichoic acid [Frankiales bacterium]|nr:Membrane protein involved in the export of O-antigen and teichoic acid [Frankiales bacterium]
MSQLLTNERAGIWRWRGKLGRDYAATYVVEVLTLVSGLALFHLVAAQSGPDGFTYYQVARGVISTLQPVVMVGLVIALQRYLPRAGAGAGRLGRQAFLVLLGLVTVVGVVGWAAAPHIGDLLAIPGGAGPVRTIFVALAGICLLALAVAALWGTGRVAAANVSTLVGLGVVPVVAFQLVGRVDLFLAVQGAVLVALAVAVMALVVRSPRRGEAAPTDLPRPGLSTVLTYGLRRVPGDVALPALYVFPVFFVSNAMDGGPETGYLGFATSTVALVCSVFATLTPVLLPRLSGQLAGPSVSAATWRSLRFMPIAAVALAGVAVGALFLLAPVIVRAYLGPEFAGAVPVLRFGLLPAVALAAFYAARPVLDALQDRPLTVPLLVGSLAVEVATTYLAASFLSPTDAAITGFGIAALMLGGLSQVAVLRATGQRLAAARGGVGAH